MYAWSKETFYSICIWLFVFQIYLTHVWFCMILFHSQGQEILSQVSQTISDESDEDDHQNVRTPVY